MVGTYSVVLQSPSYNGTGGAGEQLPLPAIQGARAGNGLTEVLQLFSEEQMTIDLGKLKEVITVNGVFTDANAADALVREGGSAYVDALHMRDVLTKARKTWPKESASGNWGSAGLPADEQDATTTRAKARVRLIMDKTHITPATSSPNSSRTYTVDTGQTFNLFFYGIVAGFQEGPRVGASHRSRIPFSMSFIPSTVVIGA